MKRTGKGDKWLKNSFQLEQLRAKTPGPELDSPEDTDAEAAADLEGVDSGTEESRQLCEEISNITGGVCFLGFSRGKDSIAAWLYLRRFFKTIIPFHCSMVPHLKFVDESLEYYEKFFRTQIYRFVDGNLYNALAAMFWQPPGSDGEIDGVITWLYDKHDIVAALRKELDIPDAWCAYGINATDSIDRRIYVNKYQGRIDSRKSFYPCYNWKKEQIIELIKSAGVRLPKDYLLANRSVAGMPNYRQIKNMATLMPDDYARIKLVYPMLDAELARQEFRGQHATSQDCLCTESEQETA